MSLNDGEFQHERIDMDSITFSGELLYVNEMRILEWTFHQVKDEGLGRDQG